MFSFAAAKSGSLAGIWAIAAGYLVCAILLMVQLERPAEARPRPVQPPAVICVPAR